MKGRYHFDISHYGDESIYIRIHDDYSQESEIFCATVNDQNTLQIRRPGPSFDLGMILLRVAEAMLKNG